MIADYSQYANYVNEILRKNDFSSFKSNGNYTYMLEHVNAQQGREYLECIQKETGLSHAEIRSFCVLNDSIGNPNRVSFSNTLTCSPTSLRYIWHAYLALKHFRVFDETITIVEVGGGYGGLCLAVNMIAQKIGVKVNSYTIVDLDAPSRLQEAYLSNFPISFPTFFHKADTYGAGIDQKNLYLISNYCFSEITNENQKKYREILFPKVIHGFMAWNFIPVYNFGFDYSDKPEVPQTGNMNRFVYF